MRLDRFLADGTGATRSDVRRLIRAGRVSLDGQPVRHAGVAVAQGAVVCLDGNVIAKPAMRYVMLNKPPDCVCTAAHDDPRSVLRLLPTCGRKPLQCVGRLDVDTTGLLLLTDDGQWNRRVSRPGHLNKVYCAELAEPCTNDAIAALCAGVQLRHEAREAVALRIERVAETCINITVDEGRYHLIKRMLAAVGNRVVALHRIAIGPIALDAGLAPGEWRNLTDAERSAPN
ncbi:MAG: pseudouridine synthase [Pseudomonadota bacterium]